MTPPSRHGSNRSLSSSLGTLDTDTSFDETERLEKEGRLRPSVIIEAEKGLDDIQKALKQFDMEEEVRKEQIKKERHRRFIGLRRSSLGLNLEGDSDSDSDSDWDCDSDSDSSSYPSRPSYSNLSLCSNLSLHTTRSIPLTYMKPDYSSSESDEDDDEDEHSFSHDGSSELTGSGARAGGGGGGGNGGSGTGADLADSNGGNNSKGNSNHGTSNSNSNSKREGGNRVKSIKICNIDGSFTTLPLVSPKDQLDKVFGRPKWLDRPSFYWEDYFSSSPSEQQQEDNDVITPQLEAAIRSKDPKRLQCLWDRGVSMNAYNPQTGETVIQMVCQRGCLPQLEFLMSKEVQACARVRDRTDKTPLHEVCWNPTFNPSIAMLLLKDSPELLWSRDCRGFLPLDYVPKRTLIDWYEFLEQKQGQLKLGLEFSRWKETSQKLNATHVRLQRILQKQYQIPASPI